MCVHLGVNIQLDCYRELQGSSNQGEVRRDQAEGSEAAKIKVGIGQRAIVLLIASFANTLSILK